MAINRRGSTTPDTAEIDAVLAEIDAFAAECSIIRDTDPVSLLPYLSLVYVELHYHLRWYPVS